MTQEEDLHIDRVIPHFDCRPDLIDWPDIKCQKGEATGLSISFHPQRIGDFIVRGTVIRVTTSQDSVLSLWGLEPPAPEMISRQEAISAAASVSLWSVWGGVFTLDRSAFDNTHIEKVILPFRLVTGELGFAPHWQLETAGGLVIHVDAVGNVTGVCYKIAFGPVC